MKVLRLFLFAAAPLLTLPLNAVADPTTDLVKRLAAVQTLSGSFEQVVLDQGGTRMQEASGDMHMARGNRFRWHTKKPFEQLAISRSEEHTSELQSRPHLVCRLLLDKKKRGVKTISQVGDVVDPDLRFIRQFMWFLHWTQSRQIYPLSLHDALPISVVLSKWCSTKVAPVCKKPVATCIWPAATVFAGTPKSRSSSWLSLDRKSTRLNSSHVRISYAVFCLTKKNVASKPSPKSEM